LNVESGYYVEDVEVEEPIPEEKEAEKKDEKKDGDTMDTDANGSAESKPKTRKIKKQVKKGELPLSSGTASLDQASKDTFAEKEGTMFMEDKLVADTEDKKNELETYIYDLRAKIDDQYADFASQEEKTKLKEKLEASEDWLYDEGEDATRGVYVAKMDEIRFVAGPIVARYQDKIEEERQAVLKIEEEKAAKKRAELEARRKQEQEQQQQQKKKDESGHKKDDKAVDQDMKDANADAGAVQPDGVEEPEDKEMN